MARKRSHWLLCAQRTAALAPAPQVEGEHRARSEGGTGDIVRDVTAADGGRVFATGLFGLLGISAGGLLGSIVTATVGAVVLLFIVRTLKKV